MLNYFDFPSVSPTPDWLKFVATILNFNSAPDWLKFVAAILNFNSAPDGLKFQVAILDLENNRFHCSPNNSLLFGDWILPIKTGKHIELSRIGTGVPPGKPKVGLMSLKNFNMVVTTFQIEGKHISSQREVGHSNFPIFVFDAHLTQKLINVSQIKNEPLFAIGVNRHG